jgi:hypothetical protein
MKQSEVQVGETYWTRVGGDLVLVKVLNKRHTFTTTRWGEQRAQTRFVCQNVDNGRVLPKLRSAAALRKRLSGAT